VKKIILVANSTWNIYNFRLNLIERLLIEGYTVFVVAPTDKYITYLDKFPEVVHVPLYSLKRKSTNFLSDLKLLFELFRIYKKINPDAIIHYTIKPNIYGGLITRILKIKNIPIITGLGYTFINKGLLHSFTNFMYRLGLKNAVSIIFENIDDRKIFIENKIVKANNSVSMKGCGTNIAHFKPIDTLKSDNKIIISYVGRYLYDKGILEFVNAAQLVKQQFSGVEFWLIGCADFGNPTSVKEIELRDWVAKKIIIDKGFAEDVRIPISQSDCIVCPSYREAIPRVIQEGMAMEKIVITTNVPGCYEAVDDNKNGFLVDAKNTNQLADAFLRVIKMSAEERLSFGKVGRKKVIETFDDRLIAKQIVQVVAAALGKTEAITNDELQIKEYQSINS